MTMMRMGALELEGGSGALEAWRLGRPTKQCVLGKSNVEGFKTFKAYSMVFGSVSRTYSKLMEALRLDGEELEKTPAKIKISRSPLPSPD